MAIQPNPARGRPSVIKTSPPLFSAIFGRIAERPMVGWADGQRDVAVLWMETPLVEI